MIKNDGSGIKDAIDFVLRRVFKLDPEEVRQALQKAWRTRFGLREDDAMPRIDPAANNIQRFMLGDNFQQEFDRWKAEVEGAQDGTLEIVHEEPIVAAGTTMGVMIFWRIAPRRVVTGARGRGR